MFSRFLGLKSNDSCEPVHSEFSDQLERSEEGWYQTGIIWKSDLQDFMNKRERQQSKALQTCSKIGETTTVI